MHKLSAAELREQFPGIEFWETTPKWHWRYWIGHRMRRYEAGWYDHDGGYIYRTFGAHARKILEERCNGEAKQQDCDGQPSNGGHSGFLFN